MGCSPGSGEIMSAIADFFQKVWGALLSFNFLSDFLDIILVTFVIYEAIKLVRGSRTLQVLKGIAFLAVLYLIVKLLNMEASDYLLSMLFKNALLILVVLFAPEIRQILEKFGRRSIHDLSIFNLRNTEEHDRIIATTVNNFCRAASDMSDTKTGSLVVFERETPLSEIVGTGTVLDAVSSPELFNGLFFKNSALHDGAVIVRDGKIFAAGCILPLTQNTALSSDLGTRHRAAIGMSEQSDAIVAVVSEETGGISVATDGKLRRNVQTGELRDILMNGLTSRNDPKNTKNGKKNKKKIKKDALPDKPRKSKSKKAAAEADDDKGGGDADHEE